MLLFKKKNRVDSPKKGNNFSASYKKKIGESCATFAGAKSGLPLSFRFFRHSTFEFSVFFLVLSVFVFGKRVHVIFRSKKRFFFVFT